MNEIKIADKPTLDDVKTNTELIKALLGNIKVSATFGFNVEIPQAADDLNVLPNSPNADGKSSAVSIRGEIYTMGSDIAPYNQTSKYTPTTGLWKTLAPCPSGARNSKSVELNGEIYTLGGQGVIADSYIIDPAGHVVIHSQNCTLCGGEENSSINYCICPVAIETYTVNDDKKIIEAKAEEKLTEIRNPNFDWAAFGEYNLHLRKYNPLTNTWTPLADSPTGSRCVSFSAYRGKLYIVGDSESNVHEYDPLTNVWSVVGKIPPINRGMWGADLIGNNIFLTYTPLNGTNGSVFRFNPTGQLWKYMDGVDFPITFTSSVVHKDELYIFGAGGLIFGYRKTVKYNPTTERWTELADRPVSAEDSTAVIFDGNIYVFGGQVSPYTQVTKYSPATNTWETLAAASFALRYASAVVIGSEIFVVGVWGSFGKYNPQTNTWVTLTGAPTDLSHTTAITYNGEMYVFGRGGEPVNTVRKYNPTSNEWLDLASSPNDIYRAKAVRIGTDVFVIGGSREGFRNLVRRYSLTDNSWTMMRNIPELVQFLQGVSEIKDNNLYIFEGLSVLRRNMVTGDWARMGNAPAGIATEAIGTHRNTVALYLFGNNASHIYHTDSDSWGNFASPLFDAREADCAVIGENFFIVGGNTNFQRYASDFPGTGWMRLPDLPNGHLTEATAAERDGVLYLIGSENPPHTQFRCFNIRTQTWERLPDCPIDARGGAMAVIGSEPQPLPPDLNIVQIFIPVGRSNRPGRDNQMLYVTIHETDNTSPGSNARGHAGYLNTDGTAVSWHYTVDDTETVQHLPENEDAFHAGDGAGNGNRHSIAIEICVNSDGDFPQAVKRAQQLTADICNRRNIPLSHVVQHNYWSGKNCPSRIRAGNPYSWNTFLNNININTAVSAIYIINGTNMYGYDFEWRVLPSPATPLNNGSVEVLNGELYVAGSGTSFRKYNPNTKAWVGLASCPVDASFSALTAIDGVLYLVGGNIAPYTQLSKFDPNTGGWSTWKALSPCPKSAYNAVAVAIRGKLFVVGNGGDLCIYNPAFDLWETRQSRIPNAEGAAAVMVDDSMVIAGGETPLMQLTPGTRFINQIVAEVKAGQRIFYNTASTAAFLRLNGEIVPHGASTANSDGELITDVSDSSGNFIRGWVQ